MEIKREVKYWEDGTNSLSVKLTEYPNSDDWFQVKRRALVTVGLKPKNEPDAKWKHDILKARHSPIRRLFFSFDIECPYWVSVHLCRHIHAQPYVGSQRNDRQTKYDRNSAPQNTPVSMIWDMNAEELMVIANKRLCRQASEETRKVVQMMCDEVIKVCPEFKGLLVKQCSYGRCNEMYPCWECGKNE